MSVNLNPFEKQGNSKIPSNIQILPQNKFHRKNQVSSFTLSKLSGPEEKMIRELKEKQAQYINQSQSVDELMDENDSLFRTVKQTQASVLPTSNIS